MEFVRVLDTSELPAGKMAMVTVGATQVLLANVAGSYLENKRLCGDRLKLDADGTAS